ncbi:MAG TPA: hypothetical protein VGZ22_09780 [Isosphaeraceae bacterium]|jgi:hypothetical protein|nr:hypothetical protein [Isosphaeraceae bacterium]
MRVKMFTLNRKETVEELEEQVNALIKACEQQWDVVDADIVLDQQDPQGRSYLVVKYNEKT